MNAIILKRKLQFPCSTVLTRRPDRERMTETRAGPGEGVQPGHAMPPQNTQN